MANNEIQKNNLTQLSKGLHSDNSYVDSPKGTYRFALNSVHETELGDFSFISNEESNEIYTSITEGYIPIGKCYIGNNELAIFSVSSDNINSEIGILKSNNKYEVYVNDTDVYSSNKLNFRIEHQIQAVYRLRKGCERTLYFTDDYNPPRYFNFDKLNQFKENDLWVGSKFDLVRRIKKLPKIDTIEVQENNGSLKPGSYSILVQYLDDDFNTTEFLELVDNINIYNDSINDSYSKIEGSTNIGNVNTDLSLYAYEKTNKSIKVKVNNLDTNFSYIRFAFIEYTNGSGEISSVKYSEYLSIDNPVFIYTGDNASTEGTIEEVRAEGLGSGIKKAAHIEQIENRLLLANIEGEQAKLCKLQQYASKIKADAVIKDIILTNVKDENNPKNSLVKYNGLSFQPGEVYSLGIIYQFEDNTFSNVCHIPGKSSIVSNNLTYSIGDNVYPMSNINNTNNSEVYTQNSNCEEDTYWGVDSEGDSLSGQNVRHHRFPTRDDLGIGFVEEQSSNTKYKQIVLSITGDIKQSNDTEPYTATTYTLILRYTLNGVIKETSVEINPDINSVPDSISSSLYLSTDTVTDIQIIESVNSVEKVISNGGLAVTGKDLTYTYNINTIDSSISKIYTAPIFGIKFSGIEIPDETIIGKKIIGYQIVKQERRDIDKTILDSAVVLPMMEYKEFTSSSMIAPEFDSGDADLEEDSPVGDTSLINTAIDFRNRSSKDTIQLLTPLHKFSDKTFDDFTTIEEVGKYTLNSRSKSGMSIQDVYDGSSADGIKDLGDDFTDDDGWTLREAIRYNEVKYTKSGDTKYILDNLNTRMYNLEGLAYSTHLNEEKTIYNLSCDNKSLVLAKTGDNIDIRSYSADKEEFPYVYIKKDNNTFYSNFRNNIYYTTNNIIYDINTDSCEIYAGDIYIAPLRYSTHIYSNAVSAYRKKAVPWYTWVAGALIAVAGVALAAFTGGTSLAIAGGILLALGAAVGVAATVIDTNNFNEIYSDKWEKGLSNTMLDKFYHRMFIRDTDTKGILYWQDDTFRWFGEVIGDLWFETPINISLRVAPRETSVSNYLQPLSSSMTNRSDYVTTLQSVEEVSGIKRYKDVTINSDLGVEGNYFLGKIAIPDSTRNSGRSYNGISIPIIYMINNDFNVTKNIKQYYQLPLSYDCCSKCVEDFPHRIHYSEQSFQEETTDNYRTFLSNNYTDIQGESGEITNLFKISNNLFIHTEEALWQMPRSYQERVTDQIISFIGTGSYFEVPPRKLIDDDTGNSAGTRHKWSSVKTPMGYFFVSENQNKIFQFDGQQLKTISNEGISSWFKNNIQVELDRDFYKNMDYEYPNRDNPSNPIGTGFISTYDSRKERILFTKKDTKLSDTMYQEDTAICTNNGKITLFEDLSTVISEQEALGYSYEGIEDCKLKFSKENITTVTETRYETETVTIANNVDIHVFYDTSGSFSGTGLDNLKAAIASWITNIQTNNPNWKGTVYEYDNYTERWVNFLQVAINTNYSGVDLSTKDVLLISFTNEADSAYHLDTLSSTISDPTAEYTTDYNNFISLYSQLKSFKGINYATVFSSFSGYHSDSTVFLQHSIAAIKGTTLTTTEANALDVNNGFSSAEWDTLLASLESTNPYETLGLGLENYGWLIKTNIYWDGTNEVITEEDFQTNMEELLAGDSTTNIIEVEVEVPVITIEDNYIEGTVIEQEDNVDNSWTISYSLKLGSWLSWHSYLPNMYLNIPNKFYSWKYGNNNIWIHNILGNYQTFYGIYYPHIIEYTSIDNPLITKIWNYIMLQTEAKLYDSDLKEYSDIRETTFNKAIIYNSRQCSGLINLIPKDTSLLTTDYLGNQIQNNNSLNNSIIDRTERNWFINDFRDIRTDYTKPIWISNKSLIQSEYFIDKILNTDTMNIAKDWTQLENFRDKYLVVRLIFDNFAEAKLITNISVENEQESFH